MITRTYFINYRSVSAHYDRPVPSCPHGSCGIVEQPDCILLVSYTTVCGDLTNDGWLTPCHYSSRAGNRSPPRHTPANFTCT